MNAATLDLCYFWFAITVQLVFFFVFFLHLRQLHKQKKLTSKNRDWVDVKDKVSLDESDK